MPSNRKRSPKGRSPDTVAEGNLYGVVLRGILNHFITVKTFAPSFVTAIVCSKWQDREPSLVS